MKKVLLLMILTGMMFAFDFTEYRQAVANIPDLPGTKLSDITNVQVQFDEGVIITYIGVSCVLDNAETLELKKFLNYVYEQEEVSE